MADTNTNGNGLSDIDTILRALGQRPSSVNPRDTATRSENLEFSTRYTHPYAFENDVILLAISTGVVYRFDEADGRKCAVSLGCARLDTKDLNHLALGAGGCEWEKEIRSEVRTIAGMQHKIGAQDFVAGCAPSDVRELTENQLRTWLRINGERTGANLTPRRVIVLYDYYEYDPRVSKTASLRVLEQDLGWAFKDMEGIVKVVSAIKLHNDTKTAQEPFGGNFSAVSADHGIPSTFTLNIGDRATRILKTTLAIALKAAAGGSATAQTVEPIVRSDANAAGVVPPGPAIAQVTTQVDRPARAAEDVSEDHPPAPPLRAPNEIVRGSSTVQAPRSGLATPPGTPGRSTAAAAPQPPQLPLAPEIPRPSVRYRILSASECAADFDSTAFTSSQRRTVRYSPSAIENLPHHVGHGVGEYTEATELELGWLILRSKPHLTPVQKQSYILTVNAGTWNERSVVRWPVTVHCRALARIVKRHYQISNSTIEHFGDNYSSRTFVSDWYKNVQTGMPGNDGMPGTCTVVQRTESHRAFARMIKDVRDILAGTMR
ncbi:hypothetical protein LTR10_001979 [Elasticomyces elasticus]|nr:hypothetical protein LTR10_001979 [Elasticomyces elasticus]KAK4969193.1 hypothetical protein LTR42_009472 [Elasticomyces elasticus]